MKINHCYLFMTDLHYVTCSHCIFLKGSDKIWKLVQGCVRGIRSLQWVRDVSGELKINVYDKSKR